MWQKPHAIAILSTRAKVYNENAKGRQGSAQILNSNNCLRTGQVRMAVDPTVVGARVGQQLGRRPCHTFIFTLRWMTNSSPMVWGRLSTISRQRILTQSCSQVGSC